MLPRTHIIVGFIVSFLLGIIFPQIGWLGALVIFLSSFLIDVDHYLYYVYKTKDWSLRRSIIWFNSRIKIFEGMSKKQKQNIYTGLCFLHGLEAISLLVIFILFDFYFSSLLLFILIGFILHQILDAIDLYQRNYRYDKVISFFYSLSNSKNKKLLQEF